MEIILALLFGYLLDLVFGDPHSLPHPVQGYGLCISKLDRWLRGGIAARNLPKEEKERRELWAGVLLVAITVAAAVIPGAILLWLSGLVHPWLRLAVMSIICYQMLAAKSLKTESMKVYDALKTGDIEASRYAVSMIVGRDTKNLTEEGVTKAAVETVAENTSDGVIAPLFYMAIGGPLWGIAYKAVNTMDSMVGYRNDKYLYFGRAAARLDDALNYIPARLSAMLMLAASFFLRMRVKNGWKIYWRDKRKHASPNSAHTEAVMAGVLGVSLAGDAWYFGELHKKETIGDPIRPVEIEDIRRANRLLYATTLLAVAVFLAVRAAVVM